MSIYEQGLNPAPVNHIALSPLSFIERTAAVYPHYPAVVHGAVRRDWAQTYARCRRLASALAGRGIKKGDTQLATKINNAIVDMIQDGSWENAISDNTKGTNYTPDVRYNPPIPDEGEEA